MTDRESFSGGQAHWEAELPQAVPKGLKEESWSQRPGAAGALLSAALPLQPVNCCDSRTLATSEAQPTLLPPYPAAAHCTLPCRSLGPLLEAVSSKRCGTTALPFTSFSQPPGPGTEETGV